MSTPFGAAPHPGPPGGFRSQPRWLRVLLIASLAALAAGIVRCSFEATAPRTPTQAEVT